ncbi:MAG: hypothetical protein ACI4S4_03910 [Candidatus Ornithospirochaeta sp.]
MISVLYYVIITIFALVLLYALATKKEKLPILISIAIVAVVFALRALHIK